MVNIVALFVSAWIEMILQYSGQLLKLGRTLCECVDWNMPVVPKIDLKNRRTLCECVDWNKLAILIMWQLTCRTLCECVDWNDRRSALSTRSEVSHSLWVRGLKFDNFKVDVSYLRSHSLWVRGLKYFDKNRFIGSEIVALFVSAWIEINPLAIGLKIFRQSHSLWVRGLK